MTSRVESRARRAHSGASREEGGGRRDYRVTEGSSHVRQIVRKYVR